MSKKNSLTTNQPILTIDALSYFGGRGVGRLDGVVVFVADTAPGDRVRVAIKARKKRFMEAELLEVIEPSPHRRTPPCPYAGRCGGCSWQHIGYGEQVRRKAQILRDALRRLEPIAWQEFLPSPEEFHYRNRIQLHVEGERYGYYAKRSHRLVSIDRCLIAETPISEKLAALGDMGGARRVELAIAEDGALNVMPGHRDPHAAVFAQVNRAQNAALKQRVVALSSPNPTWIYDLYCGRGNLTLPLRERFKEAAITGIELSAEAIARAPREPNISWRAGDVAAVLRGMKPQAGAGLIVLDPPRTGADPGALAEIKRHSPAEVIYVSCDPPTFARDAERLRPKYRLVSVQGLDMFPQTEHVELIARFQLETRLEGASL